jgi:hypothetical protein
MTGVGGAGELESAIKVEGALPELFEEDRAASGAVAFSPGSECSATRGAELGLI